MAIIINELLCYVVCKIDSLPVGVLVKLIGENFSDEEIETAKSILCDHVDQSIKAGNRRGMNKTKMNLEDIAKMMIECDRSQLPKFVALNLKKLPPITADCIDVSDLMRKQQVMDIELSTMKDMIRDILKVTADTSKKVEEAVACRPSLATVSQSESSGQPIRKSYADVVQDLAIGAVDGEWRVANSAKKGKPPAPRAAPAPDPASPGLSDPGTVAAGAVSSGGASPRTAPSGGATPRIISSGGATPRAEHSGGTTPRAEPYGGAVPRAAPSGAGVSGAAAQASAAVPPAPGRMNSPPRKTVIGAKKHGTIRAVATSRRYSMFMSRLPPGTGEEAVSSYVREQTGAEAVTAVKLPTRFDSYESYRLDIVNSPADLDILDPQLWAEGLIVRRFFQRRGATSSTSGVAARGTG